MSLVWKFTRFEVYRLGLTCLSIYDRARAMSLSFSNSILLYFYIWGRAELFLSISFEAVHAPFGMIQYIQKSFEYFRIFVLV